METLLPRIWVFVLAFGLGISITAIWKIYTLPALPESGIRPIAVLEVVEMPAERPQIVGGNHSCGAAMGPVTYDYSDGGRVMVNCKTLKSPEALAQELQKRLHGATIEEQSFNLDGDGNPVGKEILISAPTISRIRTNGRVFCEVQASSLNHLNWFEKPFIEK